MTDVPAALRHRHSPFKPGGRLAFNCWAEQSYVTSRLLREIAAVTVLEWPLLAETLEHLTAAEAFSALLGSLRQGSQQNPQARFSRQT